jgi:hypothetical protein
MSRRLPFEIIPDVTEFISISQQVYSVMAGKFASEGERKAIGLIELKWSEGDSDEFGIEIPIRSGWSGSEMLKLDVVLAHQRFASIAGMELIAAIASKKEISIEAAGILAQAATSSGSIPDDLVEFAPEIVNFYEQQQAIDSELLRETALMRRSIPAWTQDLTLTLHSEIRRKLAELVELEEMGEPSPKPVDL